MTSRSHLRAALALTPYWFFAVATATASPNATPTNAETVDRLYRLDCGRSVANDESVWTPGENVGKSIEFLLDLLPYSAWQGRADVGYGGFRSERLETPKDGRRFQTSSSIISTRPSRRNLPRSDLLNDVNYLLVSHTHGDHIGNVELFPNATVVMQKAEYDWIYAPPPSDPNLNTLVTLARTLLGHPKRLELISGDVDLFRDGSVTLLSTPGHTPGSQSLMVHLKNTEYVILFGDVAHLEVNFNRDIVPALNVDKAASIASMERIKGLMEKFHARLPDKSRQAANRLTQASA